MIKNKNCCYHPQQDAEKKCHRCNRFICSYDVMSAYHIFDAKRLSQIAMKEPRTDPPRPLFNDPMFSVAQPIDSTPTEYTVSPSYFCPICYYILMKEQVKNGVGSQIAVLMIFLLPFFAIFLYMFSTINDIINVQYPFQAVNIGDILFDGVKIFVGIFVIAVFLAFIGYIFKQWSSNKVKIKELNDMKENFLHSIKDKNLMTSFENSIVSCHNCSTILTPSESFCIKSTPAREPINIAEK